jgi:steroid Delta-isomerase
MNEQIRASIDRYVEVMTAGDKEGYLAAFAEGATVEDPVGAGTRRGHEEIAEFFDLVRSLADRVTLVLTGPVRVAGSEAAFPMQAISEMGDQRMVVDIIDVMTFDEDGKITSMRAFWDPAEMRSYDG